MSARARFLIESYEAAARRAVLLGLVVGVPLLFLRMENDPFNVPKLALLAAGLGIAAGLRIIGILQGASPAGLTRLLVPAAAVAVPLLASWIASPYKAWTLFGNYGRFQGLVPYLLAVLLGVLIADAFEGRARQLAWGFVIAGAGVAGYAIVQILGLDPFEWALGAGGLTTRATSTLGNPDFNGGFLAISLPIGIGLWWTEPARRRVIVRLLAVVLGGLIVTFSQGAYAAAAAGVVVVLGFVFVPRWQLSRTAGAAIASLICAVLVAVVVVSIVEPGNPLDAGGAATIRGRWWVQAVRMMRAYPVFGRGPNSFTVEGARFRTVDDAVLNGYEAADDPHNVELALGAGAGGIALIGVILLAGWVISRWRELNDGQVLAAAFLGGVVAYLAQSLVSIDELSLRIAFWAALGGFAAALLGGDAAPKARPAKLKQKPRAAASRSRKKRARPTSARGPLSAAPAVAVVALLSFLPAYWSGRFLVADARALHARQLASLKKYSDASREFARARDLSDDYHYRRLHGFAIESIFSPEARNGLGTDELCDLFTQARRSFSYTDNFPEVTSLASYGRMLNYGSDCATDADETASAVFLRAVQRDPMNPLLAIDATDALIETDQAEEAIDALQRIAPHIGPEHPSYPEFYGALALAHAVAGNESEARKFVDRVLEVKEERRALEAQKIVRSGH
ncbi:MAG: O-antigen ligase family protein [Actinomycetota bacterium]